MHSVGVCRHTNSKSCARISARHLVNDNCYKARCESWIARYSHFSDSRIGQESDVFYGLAQIVENRCPSAKQCPSILCRSDALTIAFQQLDPKSALQFRNGSGNCRLPGVKDCGGLTHAARFHDRHQDVNILQFHSTTDAVLQLHGGHHKIGMTSSLNSISLALL